jgi:hypothetical protein
MACFSVSYVKQIVLFLIEKPEERIQDNVISYLWIKVFDGGTWWYTMVCMWEKVGN